jgi:hypothetical protein
MIFEIDSYIVMNIVMNIVINKHYPFIIIVFHVAYPIILIRVILLICEKWLGKIDNDTSFNIHSS